jgi:hypothetical protein
MIYINEAISIMKLYIATTIGNHLKSLKEYLGFDNQKNSHNSLTHYNLFSLYIVNSKSVYAAVAYQRNYMLKILNDDKDVVFTRKFILYEDLVTVLCK